jgi:hypothetical protein
MEQVMEMREIKEPKFIQFAKDGEAAEGLLQSIDVIEMQEKDASGKPIPGPKKKAARFVLVEGTMDFETGSFTPTGDRLCFLGTRQIIDAVKMGHIGCYIAVRFEGVDNSVGRNGNAMKRFRMWASSAKPKTNVPVSTANDLGITDADIPF